MVEAKGILGEWMFLRERKGMVKMKPYGVKRSDVHRQYHNNDVGKMNLHDIGKEVKKSARFEAKQVAWKEANQMEVEEMRNPKSKGRIYIAYGSNMSVEQMKFRCPDAQLLGTGLLEGWRLMFKGSLTGAYATIEREKGCTVPILLWRISVADEERLDRYEGFPSFYYKRTIQAVKTDEHGVRTGLTRGMAYIMHEERKLGVPSMHYLRILEQAYKEFGFDGEILGDAYDYSQPQEKDLPCLW